MGPVVVAIGILQRFMDISQKSQAKNALNAPPLPALATQSNRLFAGTGRRCTNPPPNKFRGLANYLMANRIKYARAGYWDSYIVDFLSRERVIVASTGKVRITEYQDRVDAHAEAAVDIQRVPCSGGVRFDAWCISGTQRP